MNQLVVDASVAVKWVVQEQGSEAAVSLLSRARLTAPELLVAECANILWKKARRGELTVEQARVAARLIVASPVELMPTRGLLEAAALLAIELDHPAYDCVYMVLAQTSGARFVTADQRYVARVQDRRPDLSDLVIGLGAAVDAL